MAMYSPCDTAEAVGFPIRKSSDQSLLAAPRSLSQRATSFIASQCQGIHQMPFSRLSRKVSMYRQQPATLCMRTVGNLQYSATEPPRSLLIPPAKGMSGQLGNPDLFTMSNSYATTHVANC